jgi:Protein of unknown function (DUF1524)
VLAAALVVVGLLCGSVSASARPTAAPPVWVQQAVAQLATLKVRPWSTAKPSLEHVRDEFGPAWSDVDHDHCNTRDEILQRDLTNVTFKGASDCVVATGTLRDPYTRTTIHYVKGKKTSSAVQIDHVVALSAAWKTGAATWSAARRLRFANDPVVLLAVDGPTNMAKGDSNPSEWMPPAQSAACPFSVRYATVAIRYDLAVEERDRAAMLTACT